MAKEKIVVIDDSPIVRKLAELALQEEGYKVYTAEDGEEGLKIAEEVRPAVILVDFIMPRMSGYQFCKAARENDLLKDIPLILITGKGEDVGKKFAEKFGVVDYFIKPFKSEMLVEKVNAIVLSRRQQIAEPEEEFASQPAESTSEIPAFSESAFAPEIPEFPEFPAVQAAGITPELTADTEMPFMPEMPAMPEAAELTEIPEMPQIPEMPEMPEMPVVHEIQEVTGAAEAAVFGQPTFEEPSMMEAFATTPSDFSFEPVAEPGSIFEAPVEILHAEESFASFPAYTETAEFVTAPEPAAPVAPPEPYASYVPAAPEAPVLPVTEMPDAEGVESAVDRVMQRYFTADLPFLLEKTVEDLLKQHGLVKPSNIVLSGTLNGVRPVEILSLISSSGLTGLFSVFSTAGSAEIYFDNGTVVHALTSRRGKTLASGKLAQYRAAVSGVQTGAGREIDAEALAMVAGLNEGTWFFERLSIPESLLMDASGAHPLALVLQGLRESPPAAAPSPAAVLQQSLGALAAGELSFTDDERRLFLLADGSQTISDIAARSGMEPDIAGTILDRLLRAGVLRHKGGL